MKSSMSMTLDTPWGNRIVLTVEAELDNGHEVQAGEIAKTQVDTLSMMVDEVRRQNERALTARDSADSAAVRPPP